MSSEAIRTRSERHEPLCQPLAIPSASTGWAQEQTLRSEQQNLRSNPGQPLPQLTTAAQEGGRKGRLEEIPDKDLLAEVEGTEDTGATVEEDDDGIRNDAWFASHGTVISGLLSSRNASPTARHQGATSSAMINEIVLADDDRIEVDDPSDVPYRWICRLSILASNGTRWVGTGWLAAPRLVITAGHCVFLQNHGGWVAGITVQPARSGSHIPLSLRSMTVLSVAGWVNNKETSSDYGAILLPPYGDEGSIGHYGYAALTDDDLQDELINVVGYPLDKPDGTLWGHVRAVGGATASELIYDNDTFGGMSGAPVVRWDGADYHVLGIHNYGDLAGNRATRISPEVFHNIETWVDASRGVTSA